MNNVKQNGPRNEAAASKSETLNFNNIISSNICAVFNRSEQAQIFEENKRKNNDKQPK